LRAAPARLLAAALGALCVLLTLPALALAAPPPNDDFANAQLLLGLDASATGSDRDSTHEPGEPWHDIFESERSIWYRWVAPANLTVALTLEEHEDCRFPAIAVYTGSSVSTLKDVAWEGNSDPARVRFRATAGTVYHIAVVADSYSGGTMTLDLNSGLGPLNDDRALAQELEGGSATASASTRWASAETGEPAHAGRTARASVWYRWTAPHAGGATIDTAGADFDTTLGIYTRTSTGALAAVAANDNASTSTSTSRAVFRAEADTTYLIAVDGASRSSQGNVVLDLRLALPPENDNFAAATELPGDSVVSADGRNDGATAEPGERGHYRYDPARSSVWFSWTAPSDGSLTIKPSTSWFEPVVATYTGLQVDALTPVANQPQPGTPPPGQIRLRVEAGVTYRIAVDSRASSSGGPFALDLVLRERPPNDDFADAQRLEGTRSELTGNNVEGTQEIGEPVHGINYRDPSVWYEWTAPETGGVEVDVTSKEFRTIVAVYTGDRVDALARERTATRSSIVQGMTKFRAVGGTTYRIAVDGQDARQGTFALSLRHRPVPANDDYEDAARVEGGSATLRGDNIGAASQPGEKGHADPGPPSVWHVWTAPATGTVKVKDVRVPFKLAVHTGSSLQDLVTYEHAGYGRGLQWKAYRGVTYYISGSGALTNRGEYEMTLEQVPSPANDDFAEATELSGRSVATTGTTVNASLELGEPRPNGSNAATSWYRWTAPSNGGVKIGTDLDRTYGDLDVYRGARVDQLTEVTRGWSGRAEFRAVSGTTYYIRAGSYIGDEEDFRITLDAPEPPPNDDFDRALALDPRHAEVDGTNVHATAEPGESNYGLASVWYRWTAPEDGTLELAFSGDFKPGLVVYTGNDLGSLESVAELPSWQTRMRLRVTAGTTYRLAVSNYPVGAFRLALDLIPLPPNDAFAAAQEIDGRSAAVHGWTTGATSEPGEPRHWRYTGSAATIWYRWAPPADVRASLSVVASSNSTALSVYRGSRVDALTSLAAADGYNRRAAVTFRARHGETYWIAVAGGERVDLTLDSLESPRNDDFEDAERLSGARVDLSGTTSGATEEPGEPGGGYGYKRSVWFAWTAPESGRATFDVEAAEWRAGMALYRGDSLAGLSKVAEARSDYGHAQRTVQVVAGETYRLVVAGDYYEHGAFDVAIRLNRPPPNDAFHGAQELRGVRDSAHGTTLGAWYEPGEPLQRPTTWYRWQAPTSGWTELATEGSETDTEIGAFTGDSVSRLTLVAYNADWAPYRRWSRTWIDATAGQVYWIAVATEVGFTGPTKLTLRHSPRNDNASNPTRLEGRTASATGSNLGATREVREPRHAGQDGGASVWYSWTAPEDGPVRVSTAGSDFDTLLGVYTGRTWAEFVTMASGDDEDGRAAVGSFEARAGVVYRIAVDGRDAGSGPAQGDVRLTIEPAAPPADEPATEEPPADQPALEPSADESPADEPAGEEPAGEEPPSEGSPVGEAPASDQPVEESSEDVPPAEESAGAEPTGEGPWLESPPGEEISPLVEEPPAQEPPADEPPVEQSPVEDSPAEETPAEEPPVEQSPVEDSPVEAPPVEEPPPAEGPPVEQPPVVEPPVEEPPAEASPAEPPAEEPPAEEPWLEEPPGEELWPPVDESPVEEPLAEDSPAEESPVGEAPAEDQPPADEPPAEEPPAQEPRGEDPPADETPAQEPPAEQPPADEPAATEPPAEEPPADEPAEDGFPADGPAAEEAPIDAPAAEDPRGEASPAQPTHAPQPTAAGPAAPPAPMTIKASFRPRRLASVLAKGLVGTATCPGTPCEISGIVSLGGPGARKLGLGAARTGFRLASSAQDGGTTKLVLKPTAAAQRSLRKAKALALTVQLTARAPDGSRATLTRRITVRR
jgi:hypothetical protein